MPPHTVSQVRWPEHSAELLAIRRAVFVDEQGVPEALEVDGRDDGAWHLLARDGAGLPVGCARLPPDAHIGRLAVLRSARGQGVGRARLLRGCRFYRRGRRVPRGRDCACVDAPAGRERGDLIRSLYSMC